MIGYQHCGGALQMKLWWSLGKIMVLSDFSGFQIFVVGGSL